ncbi:MAG TPA: tetratricopeptide repeat protein [Gammaproteobacteria bacterium]|nr:tetratricopeptide repeat protein [Gammaproteobacteria bacterium]
MKAGAGGVLALLTLLTALSFPAPAQADALAQLPERWATRLQPLPESDTSGAERLAREAIATARKELATLLQAPEVETERLANAWGRLAALYQLAHIDRAAAIAWDNARRLQPRLFRWNYYGGYLALLSGDSDKAQRLLSRARELDPDYAPLELRLGQLWLETDRLDEASAALEAAATRPGLRAAALYYLAQIDLLRRDYGRAAEHLKEVLEIDPGALAAHYPLAQALRHLGQQDAARRHLAQFKRRLPQADDPLITELQQVLQTARRDFGLGLQAVMAHDYEEAVRRFEKGLETDPSNAAARISYARALYLAGRGDAAVEQLRRVQKEAPQAALAPFFLGIMLDASGNIESAAARYRETLQRDPGHAGAHFHLANLRFRQGRFEAAARHYRAALENDADIPPARLLEVVARQHAGQSDRDSAADLERRLAQHPGQAELKYALVRLYSLSADASVRDSVRALTLANELAPQQPTPPNIEALALAAAADGQFEQAAKLQQQVIDMLGWMAPAERLQQLQDTLAAYRKKTLPQQPAWPLDDPLLSPPPLDAARVLREYPAAQPF